MIACRDCIHFAMREIREGDRVIPDDCCNLTFSRRCVDMRKGACGMSGRFHELAKSDNIG